MHCLTYSVYVVLVGLIRIYKWIEYRILLLFTPLLKKKGLKIAEGVGVILHCADGDKYPSEKELEADPLEYNRLLNLTGGKYNKLVHIQVTRKNFFARWANLGTVGCGETFMDKTMEVYDGRLEDLTEFATRCLECNLLDYYYNPWNKFLEWLELYAFNLQTRERAFQVGVEHYDLGNELYQMMLDPWMQYTCGYWRNATNLNEAQIHKMELIAKKLELKPGMRVLDIGCGWGTLCKYLAENYKVECVGVTISEQQTPFAREICQGLPIDIRLQDYRDVTEKFDRIVSVGMFEAVGSCNFREYMEVAERCLVEDGLFLLHTIGRNHYNFPNRSDPWSDKYIFPNGQVPAPGDIAKSTKNLFVIEDWHNFGLDYAKTLFCWREKFLAGWPQIQHKYGEGFYRMWVCYLSFARALFRSRRLHLWQIVLSKDGLKRDYIAAR